MKRFWWLSLLAAAAWACEGSDDAAAPTGGGDAAVSADASGSGGAGGGGGGSGGAVGGSGGAAGGSGGAVEAPLGVVIEGADALGLLHGNVEIQVAFTGPATSVELLLGEASVGTAAIDGASPVAIAWDTTASPEGEGTLLARVSDADGNTVDSEPVAVEVDNTAPVVAIDLPRLSVVAGQIEIPVTVEELHLVTLRLLHRDGELGELTVGEPMALDTNQLPDGLLWITAEAVDEAGHTTSSDELPIVVVNNGEEIEVEYDPAAEVHVPADYAFAEYHTRGVVPAQPDIRRLIAWLTWPAATPRWRMEFAIGQGICPHQGIKYVGVESAGREIIIDLPRTDLDPAAVARYPAEERDRDVFPFNDDPRTFGLFFGHVDPLDPADHVNESLPIEMHFVLLR